MLLQLTYFPDMDISNSDNAALLLSVCLYVGFSPALIELWDHSQESTPSDII